MESITIKVQDDMAKEIDNLIKPDYGTKTEFIREAIRDKIKELRKEQALLNLKKNFRSVKPKPRLTEEQRERIAEEYVKTEPSKILREFNLD